MLQRGTIVAGYRVDRVLGEGGMGTVYSATQLSLNRVVALKLLSAELSNDAGFRLRFEREGQLQAGLDHQNIVTVYEAGQTDQGLFLAMRLIDGPTLKALILAGQLDPRRALRILAQVAQALDEAHAAGLIHRDIKPQNVLIGKGDHTYLADFGLIKASDDAGLTGTGQFLGTIDYVAPEQIQGDPATGASDCYALCAVLYECLTGQVPFPRTTEAGTLQAHVASPPPRPTEVRPDLPAEIDQVIAAGMAKDPAERPASASELIQAAVAALSTGGARAEQLAGIRPGAGGDSQNTRVPGTQASPARDAAPGPTVPALPSPSAATVPAPTMPASASTTVSPTSERRAASRAGVAAALGLAVVAIVAGFLVGHGAKQKPAQPLGSSAVAGHLALRYPSSWQISLAPTTAAVPGLVFASPIAVTAPLPAAGTLNAGEVPSASGPTLLPATFAGRVQGALPAARPVSLGGLAANEFSGLRLPGLAGTTTVYAVPTSAGVATIVCSSASAAFLAECGRVAATLRLTSATAFPLGPDPTYARALSGALARLNSSVSAPLAALRAAGTPSAQAAAATRLVQAYAPASAAVGGLTVSPRDSVAQSRLVAALNRLAAGYGQAASAARSDNGAAYARAGHLLAAASTALTAAQHGFSALGYVIRAQ